MREIKFRGKEEYSGEWVVGNLHIEYGEITQDGNRKLNYRILGMKGECNYVIPETVGQFTGLHDKNGKEIYEGDIVTGIDYPFIDEGKQNYVGIVVFYDDAASFGYEYQCVRRDKRGISNGISNEFEANENLVCEDLELLGNITDNEELLNETDR